MAPGHLDLKYYAEKQKCISRFSIFKNSASLSSGDWNEADNRSKCKLHKYHRIIAEHATRYLHSTEMHPYDKSQQQKSVFDHIVHPFA